MKKILMLSTGGTIVSEHTESGLVPAHSGEYLLKKIPELKMVCEVECRQIMNVDSTNMQPEDWIMIAQSVYTAQDNYDGIVITHGTDTMAYSACAVSYMVRNLKKPVIFTGSQIPLADEGSDAKRNVLDAFYTAISGIPGVYIVFHGRIIQGIRAQKMHTFDLDAFHSINAEDIGSVIDGIVTINRTIPMPEAELILDTKLDSNIVQLKLFPGTDPELLHTIIDMGYRGIILEAFGCGGIPDEGRSLAVCLKHAKEYGTAVLITSQCKYGSVDLTVYDVNVQAAKLGAISAYDMTAEAAAVKLMWVLGHAKNLDEVHHMMERRIP